MKKFFGVIFCLVVLCLVLGNSIGSVHAYSGDITPPRCSIVVPEKVKLGKTVYATVVCYDINGLRDKTISTSDFKIKGGLFFTKLKVLEVSNPTTADNMTYTWTVKIKGSILGTASIALKDFSVSDTSGNGNSPVVPKNIKVSCK